MISDYSLTTCKPGVAAPISKPSYWGLRQEALELQARVGYISKPCLETNQISESQKV